MSLRYLAVIPARYGSTRLPGKPLRELCGKPLVQHVYERVKEIGLFMDVLVATDSEEIACCVNRFGGKAVITSAHHRTGTERVAEVASTHDSDIVANIQGDEPLIDVHSVGELLLRVSQETDAVAGTLRYPITRSEDLKNPHVVKVVTDMRDYALYFSRSPIPHAAEKLAGPDIDSSGVVWYKHIGVYIFKRDFLRIYPHLPQTRLEQTERLEQLRILEHGYHILVHTAGRDSIGVDTEEDLQRAENIMANAAPSAKA